MEKTVFISLPLEDLQTIIIDCVNSCLKHQLQSIPQQPDIEYITRKQTAKLLGISLPTLGLWSKNGMIPSYRIASRVRYKKDEVLNSLFKVKTEKYGRM